MELGKVKLVATTGQLPGVHSLTTSTANWKIVSIFQPDHLEKIIRSSIVKLAYVLCDLLVKYKQVAKFFVHETC